MGNKFYTVLKRSFNISLKDNFTRQVLTLMTGTALAQAIPVAISPILTRMYSPDEFGALTLFVSFIAFLGVFANGKYSLAVSLPKNSEEAADIVKLGLFVTAVFTIVIFLILLFFNGPLSVLLNVKVLKAIWWAIPISLAFISVTEVLSFWLNRNNNYGASSSAQIVRSGLISGNSIFAKPVFPGNNLIISQVLGNIGAVLYLGWRSLKATPGLFSRWVSLKEMANLGKKYAVFPKINMIHNLFDKFNTEGIIFIIAGLYQSAILGFFGIYIRIVKLPVSIIGNAFGQVLFQQCSALKNNNESIEPLVRATVKRLTLIALIPLLLLLLLGPRLFELVLGHEWGEAGRYAQVTAPLIFLQFLASPLAFVPIVLGRQRRSFFYNLIGNLVQLSSFLGGGLFGNIYVGLVSSTILGGGFYIFYLRWLFTISKN